MKLGPALIWSCILTFAMGSDQLIARQMAHGPAVNAPTLSPPYKTAVYATEKAQAGGVTASFFSHGYLIQFTRLSITSGLPNIDLYNSSGELKYQVAVWPAGATKLYLTSVDVGGNGQLVFAGLATKTNGSKSAFVATSDISGSSTKYFNTGSFLATQIAQSDDGSIWTVGAERYDVDGARSTVNKWSNYDMLRQYNLAGAQLNAFLPRWGSSAAYVLRQTDSSGQEILAAYDGQQTHLADYRGPLWGPQGGYSQTSSIVNQTWLRVVNGGVVLYDGRSGILYRYESSTSSLVSSGVNIQDCVGSRIVGFAATSDGKIYANFQAIDGQNPHVVGLFQLSFNSAGGLGKWTPVSRDRTAQDLLGKGFRVLGADGLAIVYRSTGRQVNWSTFQ